MYCSYRYIQTQQDFPLTIEVVFFLCLHLLPPAYSNGGGGFESYIGPAFYGGPI